MISEMLPEFSYVLESYLKNILFLGCNYRLVLYIKLADCTDISLLFWKTVSKRQNGKLEQQLVGLVIIFLTLKIKYLP